MSFRHISREIEFKPPSKAELMAAFETVVDYAIAHDRPLLHFSAQRVHSLEDDARVTGGSHMITPHGQMYILASISKSIMAANNLSKRELLAVLKDALA